MLKPSQKMDKADTGRASQGAGQVLIGKGGIGYIARRGIDFGTSMLLQSVGGVARLATYQPLDLLSLLIDVMPEIGLAAWNGLRLGCSPGTVRIKAMTLGEKGKSEEAPDGTAEINELFDNLPDEVGSFEDALGQNFLTLQFSGMCATEAVPGKRGTGLQAVYPVNTLTLRFKRDDQGNLILAQAQRSNANGLGIYTAGFGGLYKDMPMDRFFYSSIDQFPDDPYGRAPFSTALVPAMRMISFLNDVSLAFHRVGMPKNDIGFDFEACAIYAKDIMGLTKAEDIDKFVQKTFMEAIDFFNDLNPDDAFFHDIKTKVGTIGSGKEMPAVQQFHDILRYSLTIALKQNPVLMAFVNGSTETWSDVQWEIYSKGMQAMVQKATRPLVRCAQLHLQLLGMPYKAVAEFEPIRSIQRKQDADAEKLEIENAARKRDEGWQSQDTSAMEITGSAPVADGPIYRQGVPSTATITETVAE